MSHHGSASVTRWADEHSLGSAGTRQTRTAFGDVGSAASRRILSICSVVGLVALWYFAGDRWANVAGPGETWRGFEHVATDGMPSDRTPATDAIAELQAATLLEHLYWSLRRTLISVFVGAGIGAPLGLAMGLSRAAHSVFAPVVGLLRYLSPIALIPLAIVMWTDRDEVRLVAVLSVAAAMIMVGSMCVGATSIDVSKLRTGSLLGASDAQLFRHIILPSTVPDFARGLRLALGACWGAVVFLELFGSAPGVGLLAWGGYTLQQSGILLAAIIVISIVAVLLDLSMRTIEQKIAPWKGQV